MTRPLTGGPFGYSAGKQRIFLRPSTKAFAFSPDAIQADFDNIAIRSTPELPDKMMNGPLLRKNIQTPYKSVGCQQRCRLVGRRSSKPVAERKRLRPSKVGARPEFLKIRFGLNLLPLSNT